MPVPIRRKSEVHHSLLAVFPIRTPCQYHDGYFETTVKTNAVKPAQQTHPRTVSKDRFCDSAGLGFTQMRKWNDECGVVCSLRGDLLR